MVRCSLLVAILLAGCSSTQSLVSQNPPGTLTVDAQVADWAGALRPVDNEEFSLGVLNDRDNLYIAFVTHNPRLVRQIMMRGLNFWFDPEGGREKAIGLRFPTGLASMGRQGRPPTELNDADGPEQMQARFAQAISHFEIVQGESVQRHPINSLPNVGVDASMEFGTLTIELRVPLNSSTHFALAAGAGSTIGMGLETPQADLSNMRQGLDDAGGAGRGIRGGGGRGGAGFGGGQQGRFAGGRQGPAQRQGTGGATQEQLKLWTTVALAR